MTWKMTDQGFYYKLSSEFGFNALKTTFLLIKPGTEF